MARDLIVNSSAERVCENELKTIQKRIIYRHNAWLTALRFQLRQPKPWENLTKAYAQEYRNFYSVPEWETKLEDEIRPYLSKSDFKYVMKKKNTAAQLLGLQSADLREIRKQNLLDTLPYVEMEKIIKNFYTH